MKIVSLNLYSNDSGTDYANYFIFFLYYFWTCMHTYIYTCIRDEHPHRHLNNYLIIQRVCWGGQVFSPATISSFVDGAAVLDWGTYSEMTDLILPIILFLIAFSSGRGKYYEFCQFYISTTYITLGWIKTLGKSQTCIEIFRKDWPNTANNSFSFFFLFGKGQVLWILPALYFYCLHNSWLN